MTAKRGVSIRAAVQWVLVFALVAPVAAASGASGVLSGPVGSGNGAIHVIPSLSAPSVKNGASLTVQAVVKAAAGVDMVEARIVREGDASGAAVAALTLAEAPASLGGAAPGGTVGLWQAEWRASGLVEARYRVALTVTDRAGGTHTDRSLVFSDPIAGNSDPGTTDYPNGGMRHLGDGWLGGNPASLQSAVVDTANGYAYFGSSLAPGVVSKVSLGSGAEPPALVAVITLDAGEDYLQSAVIDPARGYAWFGTATTPGRIVKIALGEGDAPPSRVGAVTLNDGENNLKCGVIDPAGGHAWFGAWTSPGTVVKVALGEGDAPPSRVGAVTLNDGENSLKCGVIDPAGGHAWFGTATTPGMVVKVALGAGAAAPSRVGAATLDDGENNLYSAVIDPAGGHAWFGTSTSPGRVVKVALGEGAAAPSRVGAATLEAGEEKLCSAVADPAGGHAWFGTNTSPGRVVKVALGAGTAAPSRVGAVTFETGENALFCAAVHPAAGHAWFGTNTTPGCVVKVALGAGNAPPSRVAATALGGEDYFHSAVVDVHHNYAYFGTGTSPGRVVKVALGDGNAPPRRVGSVTLEPGENSLRCAVVNLNWVSGFYAYFGTYTSPGRVVKVALGNGDAPPTRVNALTLNSGENNLCCAVADLDSYAVHGYFGADTTPGRVVKVELTVGSVLPKRVGAVDFPADAGAPACAVYRPTDDYVYFGTNASPGWVVKLARGGSGSTPPGATPPQWTGHVVLATGENNLASATYYGDHLYFGTRTSAGRVVKVARGAGSAAPSRVGAVTLRTGEGYLTSAVNCQGALYFGTNTTPGRVIKVAAGAAGEAPARVGALTLPSSDYSLRSAVDLGSGYAFFGTGTLPGRAVKLSLGQRGFVKGSVFTMPEDGDVQSVSFYAHMKSGSVRLAVYDNGSPPSLLWESPSTTVPAGGQWMSIPVGNGTPSSLFLPAGTYRLAWQVYSWDDVPGYTPGAVGGGFELPWAYGAFPAALDTAHGAFPAATDAAWAQYIAYNVPPVGSVVINGNQSLTNSHNAALSLVWNADWGSGVSRMRFSNNGYTWSPWEPVAAARAWTLAAGDGYRTVRVQFRDTSGNASDRYSDYIRVDATPPTGTIVINNNQSATTTPEVTLSLTWDDAGGSGGSRMRFSNNGATWSPWEPLSATRAYTLPAAPGYHTVRVTYRDAAGNVSDRFSDYIRLDLP